MDVPLTLVVVTHNSAGWMPALAASWRESARVVEVSNVPVVIADSGSTDGTRSEAAAAFPEARVLPLENRGFGAAANAAMATVQASWVLVCNADVTFAGDFLATALAAIAAAGDEIACIAPQLLHLDGVVQPSIGRFPAISSTLRDQFRPPMWRKYVRPQPMERTTVDWASGACLLLRRTAWAAVAGFDEKYFLYVEEVDLQRRLREVGGKVLFEPALKVTHHEPNAGRAPRREVQRYAARGMLRYFAKFGGLSAYRLLGLVSLRLTAGEALASRQKILNTPTGP